MEKGARTIPEVQQTKKVLQAIKDFKYAVSGIGNFNVIHELKGGKQ